jgi:EAL domain-containing protein (putative c-di-GMP-specific phosphodiesterase class I)
MAPGLGAGFPNADIACHIAKGRGRNLTHLYRAESDEKMAMQFELGWSVRLQDALKEDGFALAFQPILPLPMLDAAELRSERGRVWRQYLGGGTASERQYEVLVRFADRGGALVAPAAFLPSAERFGLMPQLDAWIVGHALAKLGQLHRAGDRVTFTINLSGQTIAAETLVPLFKRSVNEYAIDPRFVIFEITETSAIANVQAAKRLIDEMRDMGCRFALDDFGIGFSSLYHLKHLPIDFIKIDGQFVQDMVADSIDRTIVASINDIAHSLGKQTVAEFVESREILAMLHQQGVDYAQGHYIASPQPEPR